MIGISYKQLIGLGFHIGHLFKYSKFLTRWMLLFKGVSFTYDNKVSMDLLYSIFIINVKLTNIAVRSLFTVGQCVGVLQKRV